MKIINKKNEGLDIKSEKGSGADLQCHEQGEA